MKKLFNAVAFAVLAFGASVLPSSAKIFLGSGRAPSNYSETMTTTIFHTATSRVTVNISYISRKGSVLYTRSENMSLSEYRDQKELIEVA